MLTIIHGNDVITSRKYFLGQKDENSITFDSESLEISELTNSLQGGELFGSSKKIFIENLFTRKSSKNFDSILDLLSKFQDIDVYIWSEKELGTKTISAFPKNTVQSFKIPQNIFGFLDSIRPNNPQNVARFHESLSFSDPEVVFAMIVRQVRIMLGILDDSSKNIDEVKRLAPWQRGKFVKQASTFGEAKLKEIYKKLYKIDKKLKTGGSPLTLVQNIDILLLEI